MVSGGFGVFLEMEVFDFLPACHYARAAAEMDCVPALVEVLIVDAADVVGLVGEGDEFIAGGAVVVVGHCVDEPPDDGTCDICLLSVGGHNVIETFLTSVLWLV